MLVRKLHYCLAVWSLAAVLASTAEAYVNPSDSLALVPPVAPGPYPVGCSNIEQDFSRLQPGETPQMYWEALVNGGVALYIDTLLVDPVDTLTTTFPLSSDRDLFGSYAGMALKTVVLACYPTSSNNPHLDYALPTGKTVPHMQRGNEPPIFPTDRARYPVLLFSSGLGGSPLSNDYIDALTLFASYGYVVIAPFHADARLANIRVEDLSDTLYAITHFSDYTAMQAARPLQLSASLDAVLANPRFAERMDQNQIGGFGASLGGESLLLMRGAQLTSTFGLSSKQVLNDQRLKASVGYVPYFGQVFLPAFGRDQRGLDSVTMPYLAISGTLDTTAPLLATAQGALRLTAAKQLVALEGVRHGFDYPSSPDIFTWSLAFLGGYVQDDPMQRARSARMVQVMNGGTDTLLLDKAQPIAPGPDERIAIEYYNPTLDHYFMTAEPAEAAMLDAGIVVPGWRRTGFDFKVYRADFTSGAQACRFFGTSGIGPNSHFFTIDATECAKVRADPLWTFESVAFRSDPVIGGDCPVDRVPVIRMYNNGKGGQANHRFLTSHSEITAMLVQGWMVEGPVLCSLP